MCRLPAYDSDIDQTFSRLKNHPTIEFARQLRDQHDVGFDAVVSFAISITPPPQLAERVPFGRDGAGLADARRHGLTRRRSSMHSDVSPVMQSSPRSSRDIDRCIHRPNGVSKH